MARIGDLLDELVVERLQLLLEFLQLLGIVRTRRRVDLGVLALTRRVDARAKLLVDAAGDDLAAEDADRPGQRRRLRDDDLRRHRDVVAARGGEIGHRRDQRSIRALLPRDHQLAPDRVRGRRRAAGAVDAQHDRAHRAVAASAADVFDEGIGSHRCAVDRIEAALAAGDGAGGVDDRDARPAIEAERRGADARIVVAVDLRSALAAAQLVVDLVLVGDVVDQPEAQRVLGQERTVVEQRPHFAFVLLAAVSDAAHELFVEIARQRLVHLFVCAGVALLGERVDGGLVLADVVQIGIRADLVERAAQEQLVGGDAGQVERTRRHQEHLVGRRRQVVLAVAAVLEIRVDRLAGLLEVDHRVADFLDLGPERRGETGRLEQHGAHARVHFRLPQVVDDRAYRRRFHAADVADDVIRRDLREIAADAQHERRVRRNDRLAAEEQIEEREPRDRQEDRDSEHGEQNRKSAPGHIALTSAGIWDSGFGIRRSPRSNPKSRIPNPHHRV